MKGIFLHVLVRDNNVDQALRALKKKMQREGIPGDETAELLREAFRAGEPTKIRGDPKTAQARAQEGAARRSHCRSEEESLAGARARATTRNRRRSSAATRPLLKRAALSSGVARSMQRVHHGSLSWGSTDALHGQSRLPGLFGDEPVLFFDHGTRGSIAVEPAKRFAWNAAVGSLGSVFVEHIEQDKCFSRCWLACHSPSPIIV
jgi:small subunit ribosomal protein S21